jgi:hypothetical protein
MLLFWQESGGTYPESYSENLSGLGRIGTGIFSVQFKCADSQEVEAMRRARIFGYYVRNDTAVGNDFPNMYTPAQWGMIVQDSPTRSTRVLSDGLTVQYFFACKDNNSDNLNEDPLWHGTLFLIV